MRCCGQNIRGDSDNIETLLHNNLPINICELTSYRLSRFLFDNFMITLPNFCKFSCKIFYFINEVFIAVQCNLINNSMIYKILQIFLIYKNFLYF